MIHVKAFLQQGIDIMKTLVRSLGIATILLGAAPALACEGHAPFVDGVAGVEIAFSGSTFFKDDPDSLEGEGSGVVDPVPQDDGTPGVDGGTCPSPCPGPCPTPPPTP
jgi:hypothetical protein